MGRLICREIFIAVFFRAPGQEHHPRHRLADTMKASPASRSGFYGDIPERKASLPELCHRGYR